MPAVTGPDRVRSPVRAASGASWSNPVGVQIPTSAPTLKPLNDEPRGNYFAAARRVADLNSGPASYDSCSTPPRAIASQGTSALTR